MKSSDWSGGEAGAYRVAAQEVEQLEAANEALTKRVAELEEQVLMLDKHVEHWALKAIVHETECKDLQSQLAWTPVAQGLPTADGAYEFVDMVSDGRCKLFDLYVRRNGAWGRGGPDEHWDYTHFRPITLPEAT
ncbi:MAG: hypothetical protein IPO08_20540 [Xanthomonadales bacterium]|nr:hypothetical protein [Xanthomonadales bacterium]